MPLIICPYCSRITYAYPRYEWKEIAEIVAYQCSLCNNVFNVGQVNIVSFVNDTIHLAVTFAEVVAEVNGMSVDEVYEKYDDVAKEFYYTLLFLTRPQQPRICGYFIARWDYRGTREAEVHNEEVWERVQEALAKCVDQNHVVIEIAEPDEGDSIFIAVHPDDVDMVKEALQKYTLMMTKLL